MALKVRTGAAHGLVRAVRAASNLTVSETPEAALARGRFLDLTQRLLKRKFEKPPSASEFVALCALVFEMLPDEEALREFLCNLRSRQHTTEGIYVTWIASGRIQRRAISPFTELAARSCKLEEADWMQVLHDVRRHMPDWYRLESDVAFPDRLATVLRDGMAAAYAALPKPLAFHVLGLAPLTHLPELCWARRWGRQNHQELKPSDQPSVEQATEAVVEVMYDAELKADFWVLDKLESLCHGLRNSGARTSDKAVRNAIAQRIHRCSTEVAEGGPIAAILLGWVIDMFVYGSVKISDPAVSTLANYIKAATRPIYKELDALRDRQLHPLAASDDDWAEIFDSMLKEAGNPQLRPALRSFHFYLVREHGARPLPAVFAGPCEVRPPRPSVVWPHEFDVLPTVLASLVDDQRTLDQLRVWVALLRSSSLRIGELAGLSLNNMEVTDFGVRLHVTGVGRTSLKTPAARRSIEITDPESCDTIKGWILRRRTEAMGLDELLFADPFRVRRVYRFSNCYLTLARALKTATGDNEVRVHSTRHTYVSQRVAEILSSAGEFGGVNPLEILRVEVGHANMPTTLLTYAHLLEDGLRMHYDRFLTGLHFGAADAARWTGHSADLLRQRKHRSPQWSPWTEVRASGQAGLDEAPRPNPTLALLPAGKRPLVVSDILHVASDWAASRTLLQISLRAGLPVDTVGTIVGGLEAACRQILEARGTKGRPPQLWSDWFAAEGNTSRLVRGLWRVALERSRTVREDELRAWMEACARGGLDLSNRAARGLLEFLQICGFGLQQFLVRGETKEALQVASEVFVDVFDASPQLERVAPRRGRARVYALPLTMAPRAGKTVAAATCDSQALIAFLVIAVVLQSVVRKDEDDQARDISGGREVDTRRHREAGA